MMKLYKLRIAPCFALAQSYRHSRFRRVAHGFTLIPVAFEIAKVSYARFACDEASCVFEELIQQYTSSVHEMQGSMGHNRINMRYMLE